MARGPGGPERPGGPAPVRGIKGKINVAQAGQVGISGLGFRG